jgi:CPA2 family monovalent cation:H+ antiporter-2
MANGQASLILVELGVAGLGMAAGIEPQLGAFAAAYVLFLSILGPILAQVVRPLSNIYRKMHSPG